MSTIMLNNNQISEIPEETIKALVNRALQEDAHNGDITAQLVQDINTTAFCITREDMILCGQKFAEEVITQLDESVSIIWFYNDGDVIKANEKIFELEGNARSILTAERTILNFIQMLSGTATLTNKFASLISEYNTKLLDTRKTIPGFRMAQKYAVKCGGGYNHRIGLFDGFLIKENHIRSAGGIANAVAKAYEFDKDKTIEVEVTSIDELKQAIKAGAHIIMLDNFSIENVIKAVALANGKVSLEVSGNINTDTVVDIAKTGIDFISVGAITKDIKAIDLSMQIHL